MVLYFHFSYLEFLKRCGSVIELTQKMREGRYRNDILECSSSSWDDGIWVLSDAPPRTPNTPDTHPHAHVVRYIWTPSFRLVLAVVN